MLEAVVSSKSGDLGYYNVVPTIGGGMVRAIDMHRVGFTAGEVCNIVQIGTEYGIAKKDKNIQSVVEVPKAARDALAIENPAQFFCAYLGAQLGRFTRLYAKAQVQRNTGNFLTVSYDGGLLGGKSESLKTLAGNNLAVGEFGPLDDVAVRLGEVNAVAGWWEQFNVGWQDMASCLLGINIQLRDAAGGEITSDVACEAKAGVYDFDGSITGKVGAFVEFYRIATKTANAGFLNLTDEATDLLGPNDIQIKYEYAGQTLFKEFSIRGSFNTSEAINLSFYPDGSAFFEVTPPETPILGSIKDFNTSFFAYGYLPPGTIKPPPADPFFMPVSTFNGFFSLDNGNWNGRGSYYEKNEAGEIIDFDFSFFGKIKKEGITFEPPGLPLPVAFKTSATGSARAFYYSPGEPPDVLPTSETYEASVTAKEAYIIVGVLCYAKPYKPEVIL